MSKSTKKGASSKTKAAAPALATETPAVEKVVVETTTASSTTPEVKAPEKKTEEKKAPEKKMETKKAEEKKAPEKKAEAKKELVENIYVQANGMEILTNTLTEQVKQLWVTNGHRLSSIKTIDLYVKPEEYAAYFVINGKEQGKIDL